MYGIIKAIEREDRAGKIIGVELTEESNTMPFIAVLNDNRETLFFLTLWVA